MLVVQLHIDVGFSAGVLFRSCGGVGSCIGWSRVGRGGCVGGRRGVRGRCGGGSVSRGGRGVSCGGCGRGCRVVGGVLGVLVVVGNGWNL